MFADDFRPIFDGRSLAGWETPEPRWWSVEDGAIVGRITPTQPCTTNQYLVWAGGELADFELKLESRLRGQGGINNGFQFRSRLLPDHDICGYQVDNNLETPWLVRLYDEYGRHTLAMRGERAAFDATGKRVTTPIPETTGPAWFRLEEWHEYHLTCIGSHLALRVDGRLAAEVDDHDPRRAEPQGIFALQLHSGPPTEVRFRNVQLKILKPASPPPPPPAESPARKSLRNEALAWWELDTGGHGARPPISHVPGWDRFELNVRPDGPGARLDRSVVVLDGAYFHAQPDLPFGSGPLTLHLRTRIPQGTRDAVLVSKTEPNAPGLRLSLVDSPGQTGPALLFELMGTSDVGRVQVPLGDKRPDAWHDLVARYDGKSMALFVDGTIAGETACSTHLPRTVHPLWIGAERSGTSATRHFRGDLESVAIWSRALGDAEIASLARHDDR